ncbi:hypothetical protein CR194_13015 [Salipaludibacillus keqinensis]|uniref:asparagine synthase (glutamine-hydrolyzing) n=1 Tax=Salipaludibacillus keqinensis TaxID=2045207 RepID=A0A323TT12_9BACI|nr:hypothetical protein [Salipaludibacillus keqinensis]PYZ92585.1 hypothetical protein CR194_13015 [Salipaludibacillus keqinensis]
MSDFIYSNQSLNLLSIENSFRFIYPDPLENVYKFSGDWGSLILNQNLYNGFLPYENQNYLSVVIGGPVLYFQDNTFINNKLSKEGTQAIFNRWLENNIQWDEDLSGPFVVLIINKRTSEVLCFTDLMSFIPVYKYEDSSSISLSTHVDLLAKTHRVQSNVDLVSVTDFILQGTVTFPYTIYKSIYQINPSSIHSIRENGSIIFQSQYYWTPQEINRFNSLEQATKYIKDGLNSYTNKIVSHSDKIAQFISGGEDSRLLAALLQGNSRNAYIFLDQMNIEGKKAKEIAEIYGANFILSTRDKLHYLNILAPAVDLIGGGAEHHHAHSFGFHKSCKLNQYDAVFGGLLSDALLKGSHINKVRGTGSFPFIPQIKLPGNSSIDRIHNNSWFNVEIIQDLKERHENHLNYVKTFRVESSYEWFEIWPSSMNKNIANLHTNRRLFKSYEPFMTKEVVKTSASISQKWKLNRRVFHKVAKPYLKRSKWKVHSDGRLPYFSWKVNLIVSFLVILYRKSAKRIGFIKGNQKSWGQWSLVMEMEDWTDEINKNATGFENISKIFNEKNMDEVMHSNDFSRIEKVNLLQIMYLFNENKNSD